MNKSRLFTAREANLFHETEGNGILFQKVTNVGIMAFPEKPLDFFFVQLK